eukprot:2159805-Rhodomonas_salina.1
MEQRGNGNGNSATARTSLCAPDSSVAFHTRTLPGTGAVLSLRSTPQSCSLLTHRIAPTGAVTGELATRLPSSPALHCTSPRPSPNNVSKASATMAMCSSWKGDALPSSLAILAICRRFTILFPRPFALQPKRWRLVESKTRTRTAGTNGTEEEAFCL